MNFKTLAAELVLSSDFFSRGPSKKAIFIYHDISEPTQAHHSTHYSTPPQIFKEQINYLKNTFEIIPLNELLFGDSFSKEKNYASITFDDGFYSVRELAHPYLKSMSIPFSIFVNKMAIEKNQLWVSNLLSGARSANYLKKICDKHKITEPEKQRFSADPLAWALNNFEKVDINTFLEAEPNDVKIYLDEKDIKYLDDEGVHIGSHSITHPVLSKIQRQQLEIEIVENKLYLESLVKKPIETFAIPFGKREHFNDDVLQMCDAAGHKKVLSSNPTLLKTNSIPLIPRIGLTDNSIRNIKYLLNRPYYKTVDI